MRHISCSLTTRQIRNRTKRVTRRLGWLCAKPGMLLQVCEKCMGRKPGEPLVKLAVIRVTEVRRELLARLIHEPEYGQAEAALEGFPEMNGFEFARMFIEHMGDGKNFQIEVTRIAFEYVD